MKTLAYLTLFVISLVSGVKIKTATKTKTECGCNCGCDCDK
jgi:hypothetical protein